MNAPAHSPSPTPPYGISPLTARFSPSNEQYDRLLAAEADYIRCLKDRFCWQPAAPEPSAKAEPAAAAPGEGDPACGTGSAPEGNPARQSSFVNRQSTTLSAIADLLQTITLAFLPAIQPNRESVTLIDRLLKRVIDFEKLIRHQNKPTPHSPSQPEPQPAPRPSPLTGEFPLPDDIVDEHGITNREKIALMRKVYFADVDELERSGIVQKMIPPPYDPCEIKADKQRPKKRRQKQSHVL